MTRKSRMRLKKYPQKLKKRRVASIVVTPVTTITPVASSSPSPTTSPPSEDISPAHVRFDKDLRNMTFAQFAVLAGSMDVNNNYTDPTVETMMQLFAANSPSSSESDSD